MQSSNCSMLMQFFTGPLEARAPEFYPGYPLLSTVLPTLHDPDQLNWIEGGMDVECSYAKLTM